MGEEFQGRCVSQKGRVAEATRELGEKVTGIRLETCAWRGFSEPQVIQVLDAYQWFKSGQLREHWGDDPPYWIVKAVAHYHKALENAKAYAQEHRLKASQAGKKT